MRVGGWRANRGRDSRMAFMGISTWIRGARLKTLPLAVAPVLIGASLAWHDAAGHRVVVAVLCGFVALLLQIAANFANDYSDGIRGTDAGRSVPVKDADDSAVSGKATPSRCTRSLAADGCQRRRKSPPTRRTEGQSGWWHRTRPSARWPPALSTRRWRAGR